MHRPIAVVGLGAATCLGVGMDATWAGLIAGRSGLARRASMDPSRFATDIAGMVDRFGPGSGSEDPSIVKLEVRSIHLALAAAREAWAGSGLAGVDLPPERVAVVVGSALGGLDLLEAEASRQPRRRGHATDPYLIPGLIINQQAGQVAQQLGFRGPSLAPANACASGGHAVALGALLLRAGEADVAIVGAAESAFTPAVVNGFATMRALFQPRQDDRAIDDPSQSSRPFSVDRSGFVLAEGSAMLVLATEAVVARWRLNAHAEVAGWSMNTDGRHIVMPDGDRVALAIGGAIDRAGLRPADIQYYNAHGTSTAVNDRVETAAIRAAFGDHAPGLAVSSIKGAIGHALGAASAIEAAVCVRALVEQQIPPTRNWQADPELDLDYVPEARGARLDAVASGSLGFGGTNNALVFRRWTHG